ncbi:hypothetical protein LMG7974_01610 [Campylobacter majalis]|uniref:Lipoprotein n=1 Tax=Campylobacter majalis TaxID=2790656 RepID=A0ABN7KAI2_9BACT|nr:hypothetical protein [Campylobacter majalis]CAD7289533.1 hypothetical protein LMG7974_01610 [Campylobacter majalis]
MRILFITVIALLFMGCSGKVQTNKIPNEKRWNLPSSSQKYNASISAKQIADFEEYSAEFFNQTIGTNKGLNKNSSRNYNGSGDELDIYGVGLNRGHFSEKN